MTTAFSRLREVFLDDREPQQALFCTYGLDEGFFEAEILPAVFPERLALDREGGSAAGYLNAADRTLQSVPVAVFYNHLLGDGNQLQYMAQRVKVAGAFHAKLILLDYGDRLRAVISSANLTRPAWTQLLELFWTEDIEPGAAHPWAPGLRRFLGRLAEEVPIERKREVNELAGRLATTAPAGARSEVLSSWDGPLLPRILDGLSEVDRVSVVTPFFEQDEGEGVFDVLERFSPKGRLFLATSEAEGRYLVRGPQEKIDALLKTRRWELMRVHQEWKGDDEEATLRTLHGKILSLSSNRTARTVTGSANVTRAALLTAPPIGNVELVVVLDADIATSRGMMPQATSVARDRVDIESAGDPSGEDDAFDDGAERWVEAALYWAARSEVELRLVEGAPQLVVRYDGITIGEADGPRCILPLRVRGPLCVEVDDSERTGIVPLIVADAPHFIPRGTPTDIDLETFCLYLAGAREIEPTPGDLLPPRGTDPSTSAGELAGRGAIPWRRLLAAMHGVGAELRREGPFPRGVAFVLENETRLGGLRRRLREARDNGRLLEADYAYALHELLRVLTEAGQALGDEPESQELVRVARNSLNDEMEPIVRSFDGAVAAQLSILGREIAA